MTQASNYCEFGGGDRREAGQDENGMRRVLHQSSATLPSSARSIGP